MSLLHSHYYHSDLSDDLISAINTLPLREQFAKSCFETLLQFSFYKASSTSEGVLSLFSKIIITQARFIIIMAVWYNIS